MIFQVYLRENELNNLPRKGPTKCDNLEAGGGVVEHTVLSKNMYLMLHCYTAFELYQSVIVSRQEKL